MTLVHERARGAPREPRRRPRAAASPAFNHRGVWAIYRFEMARFRRTLLQSVVTPVISTSLYFVVFGSAIGGRMSHVGGVPYGAFIVPGLIMLSLFTTSISNASFGIYFPKFTGTIYELLSAPVSFLEMIIGYVGAAVTKSVLLGAHHPRRRRRPSCPCRSTTRSSMIAFLLLTATTFSLFGFIIGIWAKGFEQLQFIPALIVTPLTFLGGAFYSIDMLPPTWRTVALFNPVVYLISGFRWSFYGMADVSVGVSLAMTSVFLLVLLGVVALDVQDRLPPEEVATPPDSGVAALDARETIPNFSGMPLAERALIFDVDGTLVDSNDAHAAAWAEALRDFEIDRDVDVVLPLIGMGGDKLLPRTGGRHGRQRARPPHLRAPRRAVPRRLLRPHRALPGRARALRAAARRRRAPRHRELGEEGRARVAARAWPRARPRRPPTASPRPTTSRRRSPTPTSSRRRSTRLGVEPGAVAHGGRLAVRHRGGARRGPAHDRLPLRRLGRPRPRGRDRDLRRAPGDAG